MFLRKCIPLVFFTLLLNPLSALAQSLEELAQQGLEAYRAGEYESAASAWQQMIEIDPQNADAYNNLGATLYQMGQPAEAADAYRQALEINGNSADTYNNLGTVLAFQEKYEEDINSLENKKTEL